MFDRFIERLAVRLADQLGGPILLSLCRMEKRLMSQLAQIQAAVAAEATVIASAVTLLNGLKAKLDAIIANGVDPAEVQALADEIGAQTTQLAAAVQANTPASDGAADEIVAAESGTSTDAGTVGN